MKGIEPPTPSLPWKCSTPELHWPFCSYFLQDRRKFVSGRRDSNSRPLAWKANALPTELLPHFYLSLWGWWDSNLLSHRHQIYSLARLSYSGAPPLRHQMHLFKGKFEPVEGFEPPTS